MTVRIIRSELVNSHLPAPAPAASAARARLPRCLLRARLRRTSRQIPVSDATSSSVKNFWLDLIRTIWPYQFYPMLNAEYRLPKTLAIAVPYQSRQTNGLRKRELVVALGFSRSRKKSANRASAISHG